MRLRMLSGGVDSLYVSAAGGLRAEVVTRLEAAKVRAQHEGGPVPVEFERERWRLLVKPYGYRGYAYWLTSPEVEVWVGRRENGPAARVQLHSLFLHGAGAEAALTAVEGLLDDELFTWPAQTTVSRVDVYADVQGWRLEAGDLGRFVSRANHRELHMVGREFTGYVFGLRGGGVQARLYEKTAQMRGTGESWMRTRWKGYDESEPVWRLEFEVRGPLLRRLESREPGAVLAAVPGLWRYLTEEWLTLRKPAELAASWRWPVDPVWLEVQGLGLAQDGNELVWREVEEASEERVLAVLQGAFTSWAAMWGLEEEKRASRAMVVQVGRYLAKRDRSFETEVRRKRALLLRRGVRRAVVSRQRGPGSPLGPQAGAPGPKAQEEDRLQPRIGRSARTARRAREGQSTFLGRPPRASGEWARTGEGRIRARREDRARSGRGVVLAERAGEGADHGGAASADGGQRGSDGKAGGDRGAGSPDRARRARAEPFERSGGTMGGRGRRRQERRGGEGGWAGNTRDSVPHTGRVAGRGRGRSVAGRGRGRRSSARAATEGSRS